MQELVTLAVQFAVLAGVIVAAGTYLTKYADAIGELTGMGGSLAGLVLLAAATSLPELAVDCNAALIGAANLAVGDLMGSSLFNLLVLAILDLSFRSTGPILSRMAAAHSLSALMSVVLTCIALIGILLHSPLTFWRFGPGTVAIMAAYFLLLRLIYFDQQYARAQIAVDIEAEPVEAKAEYTLRTAVIGYLVATAVIFIAAPFMARTADRIAEVSGLGQTFVGTTLVALSTSLPEVVTTWAAVRMGALDLAIGNIFGSNSFNMAILPVVDLFYPKPLLASVSPTHGITAACVILVTAVAVLTLLYRPEKRWWLIEPDAALLIVMIVGALYLVYTLG